MPITSKGQVTIPLEIREKAGFLPDTEVEFRITGSTVALTKVGFPSKRRRDLISRMCRKAIPKMTTDEMFFYIIVLTN